MEYHETADQAAEFIRLALPLMSRNGIPANPKHYTVWYDFVSGRNQPLKESVDRVLTKTRSISAAFSDELYDQFFRNNEEKIADQMRTEVRSLVASVLQQLATSGGQANHYSEVLEDYNARMSKDLSTGEFRSLVNEFMGETNQMLSSNRQLEKQLEKTNHELDELRHQLEEARYEASTDALTGLANRKAFDSALLEQTQIARETGSECCLIMADIDHFKHFNDNHGHLIGDKLLRFVSNILKDSLKGQDLVARFGGEEFAILLPNTPLRGALAVAESLRARVQSQRLRRTDTQQPIGGVTLSLGIAAFKPSDAPESLIARADAALYQSKHLGRNRVTLETQVPAA
ncbi:MAG TPA: GGDEF domain-containing protein [Gammaproteobacteria bacterium]|jgi:diguanylate cyclase|nr:GGDEF domain-containing protein [Gammaproteobacteria bacterium]